MFSVWCFGCSHNSRSWPRSSRRASQSCAAYMRSTQLAASLSSSSETFSSSSDLRDAGAPLEHVVLAAGACRCRNAPLVVVWRLLIVVGLVPRQCWLYELNSLRMSSDALVTSCTPATDPWPLAAATWSPKAARATSRALPQAIAVYATCQLPWCCWLLVPTA